MGGRIENPYEVLEGILAGVAKPRDLPLALLEDITDHFSERRKIGEGGFGAVYKGVLGNQNVAVKKIFVNKYTVDERLFRREVDSLMRIKDHPNLVRFLGFCSNTARVVKEMTGSEETIYPQILDRLLCFEYISNGSLDKHITDEFRGLTWDTRFNIIRGICEGLCYLHEDKSIIHMDLKPANILLDDRSVPKITDFGLSRSVDNTRTEGERFFTRGYCAPEYQNYGKTSKKSDIYSLGVIIMELVTGTMEIPDETYTKLYLYDDMLGIEPLELHFPLERNKQTSCSTELTNDTCHYIAFNILTPSKQYSTQPDKGIVLPGCKRDVKLTLKPQETATQGMNTDKFIVQSTKVKEGLADADITDHMFNNKGCREVDEVNLMVVYNLEKYQVDLSVDRQKEEVSKDIGSSRYMITRRGITAPQLLYFGPVESISRNQAKSLTNDQTMDLATGAIGSLLPKLSELLNKYNLNTSIRSDVDCVIQELRVMRADLCNVAEVQRENNNEQIKLVKLWADEIRELSYDIEDIIDDILMHVEGSEPDTSTGILMGLIQKLINLFKLGRTSHKIGGAIKEIKNQLQIKTASKRQYNIGEVVANTVSTINAHHLSALVKDREKLFGVDDAMRDLTKRLISADGNGYVYGKELKVHSIFGIGGLGKTTLARAVYNQLQGSFHLMAFVPVGRNPDVKKLFYDILLELDEPRYINLKAANLDERQLTLELTKLLKNNRYLIVIDDLWDKKIWHDLIKFAFVDSNCGSKIIITTRIFEVATIATDVYKIIPLSDGYSEELFYATLSHEEGKRECDVKDEVIEKILSKCGGVPLAIITIASLLASRHRNDWPKVYTSIGFGHEVNEDVDNTRKILFFSYSDLPRHLRTCLLHLSIFPEDRLINKDMAIWKWISEGFVHGEPGRGLFELGERYFNQLVSRSMVQLVVQTPVFSDGLRFCIHDLVLDMICSLSKDENFVTLLETDEQQASSKNNARRLAFRKRDIHQLDPLTTNCMLQLRSFYATDCYIDGMPPLPRFKALRVLSLERCSFSKDHPYQLEHIGKLLQLRYLGLEDIPIRTLPEEIGDLLFLQTLILKETNIEKLPHCVGLLGQLKCLRFTTRYDAELRVPEWLVNMTSLEDLSLVHVKMSIVFAEGLSKLKELRDLQITNYLDSGGDNWQRALVKSIGNLLNLQSLKIHCSPDSKDNIWEDFSPPRHIHIMRMRVGFSSVPPWMDSTHFPSLSCLELELDKMEARCLEILGRLPELHTLKLYTQAGGWLTVMGSGAFPKLRHLTSPTMLRFQRGVMPQLEYLWLLVSVRELKEANFDCDFTSLGNLPLLHKVQLQVLISFRREADDPEYLKMMEEAVKHALDTHPHRRPVLHLYGLEHHLRNL